MRVDVSPRHKNAPRPAEKSAPGFLQWIRGRSCLVGSRGDLSCICEGKIEAAHVDYAGGKGVGTKVADRFAVPLCGFHHRIQHSQGWHSFERRYFGSAGMALLAAEGFWKAWPGRLAWERKQEERGL